jgi:membrane-bound metal-dependent hydrolase YbcI (DUF457 family)
MDKVLSVLKTKLAIAQLSLLRHFGIFATIIFAAVFFVSLGIGISTTLSQEKNRQFYYNEQASRVDRILGDSLEDRKSVV